MVKKTVLWVLVILCMVMIFFFSAQNSDDSNTLSSSFLADVLDLLDIELEEELLEECNVFIRKAAHFSIYALLGILVSLLLRAYSIKGLWAVILPVVWVFLYASTDEIHQLFVPGRGGRFKDVLLDTSGGTMGTAFIWLITRVRKW